jgi:hypothetical protein
MSAGRIVVAGCQLKVVDGSDWTRPSWIARVPAGPALGVGELVRSRTGAEDGSRAVGSPAEVLERLPAVPQPGGLDVVRCR